MTQKDIATLIKKKQIVAIFDIFARQTGSATLHTTHKFNGFINCTYQLLCVSRNYDVDVSKITTFEP
jgi:hypothetical protein